MTIAKIPYKPLVFFAIVIIVSSVGWLFFLRFNPTAPLTASSVISKVQSLNRLETSAYTMQTIINAGESRNAISDLLFGDRILLIAYGTVIAGVDLSQLVEDDVFVQGTRLRITLPEAEILTVSLDQKKTRVYDRSRGFLTAGDDNLESEARNEAVEVIRAEACSNAILDNARSNAIERVQELFLFAGFSEVQVSMPESTSCE